MLKIDAKGRVEPSGPHFGSGEYVALNTSTWTKIGEITCMGAGRLLSVIGQVGAGGPLTALKVTKSVVKGGLEVDYIEDSDFVASLMVPVVSAGSLHTTVANGVFWFTLNAESTHTFSIYAKGNTTARVEATL